MKIGIISMQRVQNYGSFLQAYGLKKLLEGLGYEVVFIDYKPMAPIVEYSRIKRIVYLIRRKPLIAWVNDYVKYYILHKKNFIYEYNIFYRKELGIGYKHNYSERVDVAVIGSDEVFNCLQGGFNVGFAPMLFGQGINCKKVISYAASFGYTTYKKMVEYKIDKCIADCLKEFSAVSVRDQNSKEIVETLIGNEPEVHLDPVLVSEYELPDNSIEYENYVILYTYKTRKYSQEQKQQIIDFCNKNNKKLISIGNVQEWVPYKIHATPLELLNYIKSADFIITDTFHGSVFSIKYNKNFACLVRENNANKLEDLLVRLNQKERIIKNFSELQIMYENSPQYDVTNQIIKSEKDKAKLYLRNAIENIQHNDAD